MWRRHCTPTWHCVDDVALWGWVFSRLTWGTAELPGYKYREKLIEGKKKDSKGQTV